MGEAKTTLHMITESKLRYWEFLKYHRVNENEMLREKKSEMLEYKREEK